MSGPSFFQTLMGRAFYERDVPALVRELQRLNANLERLTAAVEKGQQPAPAETPAKNPRGSRP